MRNERRGRPPGTAPRRARHVTVTMTQDHYDQVTAAAAAAGHTRSTWIYLAIQRVLAMDQQAAQAPARTADERSREIAEVLSHIEVRPPRGPGRTDDHQ